MDAYKIAVRISLVEGVTRGLQLMSRHFKTTDADAAKLEARLKSIGKQALVGGALVGAGFAGLSLLKAPLEEAIKYQTLMERMKQFGLGDVAMRDAEKFVSAQNLMGTSQRDMLRYFIEAQGVFRETGAKTVQEQLAAAKMAAPVMAKINFATRGLDERGKEATEGKQMDMLRFVEQAGGLRSPQRFNALMNSGFKAIQSSGGNVDFTQYRQFMARGGTSTMGLSDRSLFADLEPIIGEMKGSTAGTALMTAFNRLNGITRLPNQVAHELVKNGLWDGSKIAWNSQGGIKSFTGNPLVNSAMLGSDPVEFYRQKVLPMYARQQFDDAQRRRENALIFGRTGGAAFNLIDKQMPTIMRSREAFLKTQGIDATGRSVGNSAAGKQVELEAKEANLKLVIGQQILPIYVKALELTASALQRVTAFARQYPLLTKFAVTGFVAVSALAVLGGSFILITAGVRAIGLALTVARLPILLPLIGTAFGGIGTAASFFAAVMGRSAAMLVVSFWRAAPILLEGARLFGLTMLSMGEGMLIMVKDVALGIRALGLALIANPIGLAIAAIAVAAYLLWKNWDVVGPKLKSLWSSIVNGVTWMINQVIGLLNHLPGVNISPIGGAAPVVQGGTIRPHHMTAGAGGDVYLDGKKVGKVMTSHLLSNMTNAAARPNQGYSGFDAARGPLRPATSR